MLRLFLFRFFCFLLGSLAILSFLGSLRLGAQARGQQARQLVCHGRVAEDDAHMRPGRGQHVDLRERWDDLINSYFEAPRHHTLLVQLLDCRHAPSADDLQMLRYLHYHRIPYVVALTKADKLKKSQLAKTQEDFENICRPYGCQKVVLTSGENGYGIPELQAVLNAAVAAENEEAE